MLRKSIIAIVIVSMAVALHACEVCGGGGVGLQLGIYPQLDKHFVGWRYQLSTFDTDHGADDNSNNTGEIYNDHSLLLRWSASRRLQVLASVPYRISTKTESFTTFNTQGLGDVSVVALYRALDNVSSGSWYHTLQLGGGVKFPTGQTDYVGKYDIWYPGLQNGTGSFDLLVNTNYIIRNGAWGGSVEQTLSVNGRNTRQDFRFGNRYNASTRLFRVITYDEDSWSLIPHLGINYQVSVSDTYQGETYIPSGGYLATGQLGLDLIASKWSVGISIASPISQNRLDGLVSAETAASAQLLFFF